MPLSPTSPSTTASLPPSSNTQGQQQEVHAHPSRQTAQKDEFTNQTRQTKQADTQAFDWNGVLCGLLGRKPEANASNATEESMPDWLDELLCGLAGRSKSS